MNLNDVGIILAPGFRSRAYLQVLQARGICPNLAILLSGNEPEWRGAKSISVDLFGGGIKTLFAPGKLTDEILKDSNIEVKKSLTTDVNSEEFIALLESLPQKVFIYSGPSGCILKPSLFRIGKKFLHAHGGVAPEYSGSTAFYYSILNEGTLGATVFWMDEGLDTGDVLIRKSCKPPSGIDVDCIADPIMRAEAMAEALQGLVSGSLHAVPQNIRNRRVYYVIHPLLKHIALKKCGLVK